MKKTIVNSGVTPKKQTKKPQKGSKSKAPAPEEKLLPEPMPADYIAMGIGEDFTARERKFIYYYTMPGPDFMNQTRAALRAGYTKKSAKHLGYQVRCKLDVDTAIKNILNSMVSVELEEQYQKVIRMLGARALFNLSDYTKQKTITIKVGKDEYADIEVEVFKDLSELTPEQLKAVDGIDYRGVHGSRVLVMADRTRTITDLVNMRNKVNGLNDNNDFDIEATADIIKGELSVKVSARKNKEALSQAAGYMETPKEKTSEEL